MGLVNVARAGLPEVGVTPLQRERKWWARCCEVRHISPAPRVTAVNPVKGGRKLTQVCAHYGVELGEDAHTSDADTLATLRLAYKLAARYPRQVGLVSLDDLHAIQIRWALAWCTRMRDYLLGQAVKLEQAWAASRAGNARSAAYLREQFERLEIKDEPSDDSVAVAVEQTRARALDFGSSGQWPMRPRPATMPHPASVGQTP